MNNENKNNDGKTPPKEPALKNYQDHPDANNELQQAIDNIPVKDYSDYEVTLETKDHYEDALFADDDSLDEALTAPQTATQDKPQKSVEEKTAGSKKATVTDIDYLSFLTETSIAGELCVSTLETSTSTQLSLSESRLNGTSCEAKTPLTSIEQSIHALPSSSNMKTTKTKESNDIKDNARTHEKILHWGKNKLSKNKTQIDEYLGRSLPDRILPLEFKFSTLKPKKELENLVSSYDIKKQLSSKGRHLHSLLKQADEDLSTVVKCQLSNKARLQLLESYTPLLCEKIRSIKGTQGKTPPYPYEETRALAAEHAQNVIKHLITGYKYIYAAIYASANHLYAPQRKTANKIAFRIIDLLCLEQNLFNVLHKPIPPGAPKTFNKLFHALARYEPDIIGLPQDSLAMEKQTTIKELFIRYQTLLSFDLMTLSPTLYKLLNQYLAHNQGALEMLSPKDWNTPPTFRGKTWMIAHDNNHEPQLASAATSDRFTAVFIRVDHFFNQVKSDYAQCVALLGKPKPEHSSPPLQSVAIQHSLTLMSELNRYINMIEKHSEPQSYSSFQAWPCKVYSGFASSYSWLGYKYSKLNQPPHNKGEAAPTLPKKPVAGTTQWQCAMEDEHTLYLQTIEKKGTPALDIGWLLLINRSTEDRDELLQLARITRIERSPNSTLNLIAEKVGNDSINVIINKTCGGKTPGIITCFEDRRFLLTNHAAGFWTGECLEILLPNRTTAVIKLKGIKALSQQLQILELE